MEDEAKKPPKEPRKQLSDGERDAMMKRANSLAGQMYSGAQIIRIVAGEFNVSESCARVYVDRARVERRWVAQRERVDEKSDMLNMLARQYRMLEKAVKKGVPGAVGGLTATSAQIARVIGANDDRVTVSDESSAIVARALAMSPMERAKRAAEVDAELAELEKNDPDKDTEIKD